MAGPSCIACGPFMFTQFRQDRKPTLCWALLKMEVQGWAWWLTPVIPVLWEGEVGRSCSQEFEEVEVAVSQDCTIALWSRDRVRLHLKKIKIK